MELSNRWKLGTYERADSDTGDNGGNRSSADITSDATAGSEEREDVGGGFETLEGSVSYGMLLGN